MIAERTAKTVSALLLALVVIDVGGALNAFFAPAHWYEVFHNSSYNDPQGLLRRMGANWAAFAVLQALALLQFRKRPEWLCIVAGARLSDVLTDGTCLAFAENTTLAAKLLFGAAGPVNLAVGLYFIATYRRVFRAGELKC